MEIKIIKDKISKIQLQNIAKNQFGDLVKVVVDIDREIIAVGGELHADEEAVLLQQGSKQNNLWGINFYPTITTDDWIEFDSMINIRPSQNNRSRQVENNEVREKIITIINKLIIR